MTTLLILHKTFAHGRMPNLQFGGSMEFRRCFSNGKNEPYRLPRPVVEAIETAHLAVVEFFPQHIVGRGTTLDYYLIAQKKPVGEAEAIRRRSHMGDTIEQILQAHQQLLNFKALSVQFRRLPTAS